MHATAAEATMFHDIDDSIIDYGGEINRMMLECYGIRPSTLCAICESASEESNERLYGVDGAFTYRSGEIADHVLEDEAFNNYAKTLYSRLDDDLDAAVLDKWSPSYVRGMLEKALGELFVGEVLKYDQLFRGLCGEGGSDPYGIVDASDRRFSFMPNIVRLK